MIRAKFIGEDGSRGFKYGETYILEEPDISKKEWKILIKDLHDKRRWCPYRTVEDFLRNWEVIELL